MLYAVMGIQFFDSENPEWAQGNAEWVVDNTKVLAEQSSIVSIGAASELTSWFGAFKVEPDGSMSIFKAWHLDDNGVVQEGLPAESTPDPDPDPGEYPAWQPWDGDNNNLYQIGDRVTHNDSNWEATVGDNHWEPGEFGWVQI